MLLHLLDGPNLDLIPANTNNRHETENIKQQISINSELLCLPCFSDLISTFRLESVDSPPVDGVTLSRYDVILIHINIIFIQAT